MTNYEFYKDEILKITEKGRVALINGKVACCDMECCKCDLRNDNQSCNLRNDNQSCSSRFIRWLYEKHVEKPKLTKSEKAFLECTKLKYIARDKNGKLYGFMNVILKYDFSWVSAQNCKYIEIESFFNVKFPFIKWEDKFPWTVEKLLKLEVVE